MGYNKYWVALTKVDGLGPIILNRLVQKYENPKKIWNLDYNKLLRIKGIGSKTAKNIISQKKNINPEQEISKLKKKNISFVTIDSYDYPESLKNIYDPPPVLYYKGKGNFNLLNIAIVGARKASFYGREVAKKLGSELSIRGITIVSGMARGIDSSGHKGAIRVKGNTIAVLASGIDYIYPPENNKLYRKIQENGLIVSEFPPGVKPISAYFPRRNRIISGLSQGVIVVEAAYKSGSLITVDFALEQGRDVFAVPGNINSYQSKGCNKLIKDGAIMVTSYKDVIKELKNNNFIAQKKNSNKVTKSEKKIKSILKKEKELSYDQLYDKLDLNKNELSSALLKLELKGLLKLNSSKKYLYKGLQKEIKPL